eukprot:185523_1
MSTASCTVNIQKDIRSVQRVGGYAYGLSYGCFVLFIFIAAVCAERQQNKEAQAQTHVTESETADPEITVNNKKSNSLCLRGKSIGKTMMRLRAIYFVILVHIFDTLTDFLIILEWYIKGSYERSGQCEFPNINYTGCFICACIISFHALPPSLLNQPHLKIQSDCIVPNIPCISLPPPIQLSHVSNPSIPDPPIHRTDATRERNLKIELQELSKQLLDLSYSMNPVDLSKLVNDSKNPNHPLQLMKTAYSIMLNTKPKDPHSGLTDYTPVHTRRDKCANKKRMHRAASSLQDNNTNVRPKKKRRKLKIPHKKPTKPQEKTRAILRDKRERLQLKRPINPMIPSDQFKEALEQQQIAIHERTQRVIEQKKKQMENIPEWYKDDSDVDMHETISNNCNNHCDNRNGNRRRSKRNVKPSDAMIQSQKYQHRINGIFDS